MPLHDWATTDGWAELHHYWQVELARHIKPQLPPGYRAHIETVTALTYEPASGEPDVGVHRTNGEHRPANGSVPAPDSSVELAVLEQPETRIAISRHGRLVAAIELVSERNKDRADARRKYGSRYVGYLNNLANLMLVDVHPTYRDFSFADQIGGTLNVPDPVPTPAPFAVSYRVLPASRAGEPCQLDTWRRPLAVGQPLPTLPLALTPADVVMIDLEATYMRAAADAYLA
jgi:hypothetical protein